MEYTFIIKNKLNFLPSKFKSFKDIYEAISLKIKLYMKFNFLSAELHNYNSNKRMSELMKPKKVLGFHIKTSLKEFFFKNIAFIINQLKSGEI